VTGLGSSDCERLKKMDWLPRCKQVAVKVWVGRAPRLRLWSCICSLSSSLPHSYWKLALR
jgi:hypothetical protein